MLHAPQAYISSRCSQLAQMQVSPVQMLRFEEMSDLYRAEFRKAWSSHTCSTTHWGLYV